MKIAVQFYGHLRTYERCLPTIKKFLLDRYDCDVFMHTWSETEHSTKSWHNFKMKEIQKVDAAVIDSLKEKYNIKSILVEEQKPVKHSMEIVCQHNGGKNKMSIDGVNFMLYSQKKANELRVEYQKQHKIKYDYVLVTRPDIMFLRDFNFDLLHRELKTAKNKITRFCAINPLPMNEFALALDSATDVLYTSSPEIIDKTIELLSTLDIKKYKNEIWNPENLFNRYLLEHDVISTPCLFLRGRDWNIIRESTPVYPVEEVEKSQDEKVIVSKNVEPIVVKPFYEKNNVPIVFSTDDNFIPYLYVALTSLIAHTAKENNYDINILHKGVTRAHQQQILELQQPNVNIRFVDITDRMEQFKGSWYLHNQGGAWHSDSVYFRFFIPEIFSDYDKIIFLDGDIVVCTDVAQLYQINLEDKWLGAVQDFSRQLDDDIIAKYSQNVLNVDPKDYFNAGIFLMNIEKLKEKPFLRECMDTLKKLGKPLLKEEDVFNVVFKGHVKYLDYGWNCLFWNVVYCHKNAKDHCNPDLYQSFQNSALKTKIFHYAGKRKPWKEPNLEYSSLFWRYARITPFYEEIIYKNQLNNAPINCPNGTLVDISIIRDVVNLPKLKRQYYRYKILSKVTFGKMRQHYREKRKVFKAKIKKIKNVLKGKSK